MPQFSLLYVIFATMLQRYEFFLNYANFSAIILLFFSMAGRGSGQVTHLPTYPPMTGIFPENVDY